MEVNKAVMSLIELPLNFFRNKNENLNKFLVLLLVWTQSNNARDCIRIITRQMWRSSVTYLSQPWGPASDGWASEDWARSSPDEMGHPCTLWILFHSMMAASCDKDTAWSVGSISTVSRYMVVYINLLLNCRDSTQDFQGRVNGVRLHNRHPQPKAALTLGTHEDCPICKINDRI